MPNLILVRHFKSQWNLENRFAGWVDNPLSEEGRKSGAEIRQKLLKEKLDVAYTSPLIRNQETVLRIFDSISGKYPLFVHFEGKMKNWGKFEGGGNYLPVYVSFELNERYYGKLQGRNREEVKSKFGEKKFIAWRRGYDAKPPGGESLKDTFNRTVPFFKKYVAKDIKVGKNVVIVASHNALRSIVKFIEKISNEDIANFEIPYGGAIKYNMDKGLKVVFKEVL